MDINEKIEQTHQIIISLLQKTQLPIGITYYLIKDVLNTVEKQYYAYLNSQNLKDYSTQIKEQQSKEEFKEEEHKISFSQD